LEEQAITTREYLSKEAFYLPEPLPPEKDKRARQLRWPIYASLIGLFCLAVLGYSFVELSVMPPGFHTALVIVGAFALAGGSELGTYATVNEVFRKVGAGLAKVWDWLALLASLSATVFSLLLAYGTLMDVKSAWPEFITLWGPLIVVLSTAFDAYAGMCEHGLYCSSYDERHREWQSKYHAWCESMAHANGLAFDRTPGAYATADGAQIALSPTDEALHWPQEQTPSVAQALEQLAQATHSGNGRSHACPYCGATANASGQPFASQQAVSAHLRFCDAYQASLVEQEEEEIEF
jgi:hypothetical protein